MAKIVCVLYDDPITGYPKSYARDDLPIWSAIPMGRPCRRRKASTSSPAPYWAACRANWGCANTLNRTAISWS